jgi:hypothetical protein
MGYAMAISTIFREISNLIFKKLEQQKLWIFFLFSEQYRPGRFSAVLASLSRFQGKRKPIWKLEWAL